MLLLNTEGITGGDSLRLDQLIPAFVLAAVEMYIGAPISLYPTDVCSARPF